MLALCLMLLVTYYALNYAGIIGLGLISINNGRILGIFLDFYKSKIALYTDVSVCFV